MQDIDGINMTDKERDGNYLRKSAKKVGNSGDSY